VAVQFCNSSEQAFPQVFHSPPDFPPFDLIDTIINVMSEQHAPIYELHTGTASNEELRLLREDEPGVVFRVVEDERAITQGRQSRVSILEYDLAGTTYRVIWKRMGAGKGLTFEEAVQMHSRLLPYRNTLVRAGWRVPKVFYARPVRINGESQIFSYEEFIPGGDGEKMVENPEEPNFRKWHMVEETTRLLFSLAEDQLRPYSFHRRELTRLPYGLDLKAANVVLSKGTNDLYFVDLFGPKELDPDGQWIIYNEKLDTLPPDNLVAVCATREGALLRFWRLARRLWEPDRARRADLDTQFLERLAALELPAQSLGFISDEVTNGCPWLNHLYAERRI
jgi:hypothetical protein